VKSTLVESKIGDTAAKVTQDAAQNVCWDELGRKSAQSYAEINDV
jgi:hypothetical protein